MNYFEDGGRYLARLKRAIFGDQMKVVSTASSPSAIGPYSQAITVNGLIYTSGQIPLDPKTMTIVGEGSAPDQARQVFPFLPNTISASRT